MPTRISPEHALAEHREGVGRSAGADALALLLGGLALDAERGDRSRLEPLHGDRVGALLTQAEGAVGDATERLVDLRDQLALAVADAQQQVAVALEVPAIGRIGVALG